MIDLLHDLHILEIVESSGNSTFRSMILRGFLKRPRIEELFLAVR
jgi:hypothetical protein